MATANSIEPSTTRSIPVWLAVLLILLCGAGGGWLAYKFLLGGSNDKIVVLERSPNETIRQGGRADTWWMRSTDPGRSNGQVEFDFVHPDKPLIHFLIYRQDLTKEQINLLRLGRDYRLDRDLKITHDQQVKLNAMANLAHVSLPKATETEMLTLFAQWKKTPPGKEKEALEDKLFSTLGDAVQSLDPLSKAKVLDKCEKVKALLTPEQIKQLDGK